MISQVAERECARVAEEVTHSVQVRGVEKWNCGAKTSPVTEELEGIFKVV